MEYGANVYGMCAEPRYGSVVADIDEELDRGANPVALPEIGRLERLLSMPGGDGTGPRGKGKQDGSGGGRGNQSGGGGRNRGSSGQGPKKGGKKGGC